MTRRWLLVFVFLAAFCWLGAERVWARSNVLVIQLDDMPARMLSARYEHADGTVRSALPRIQEDLLQGGTFFPRMYAATPLCAPSRASLLTGRFSHSNRLTENNSSPYGGWQGWRESSSYTDNLATSLQSAGYHTAHFGKFLNNYNVPENAPVAVPPGWDRWVTDATDDSTRDAYGYYLIDGTEESASLQGPFGNRNYSWDQGIDPPECPLLTTTCNYHTDMMTRLAAQEIASTEDPFYIQVDYHIPHGDAQPPAGPQPATRHIGTVADPLFANTPNYNEQNVSDKPTLLRRYMGKIQPGQGAALRENYRRSLEAMQSVDEGVGHLLDTLRLAGKLDNTYVFLFSDNGYFYGEHRFLRGKFLPHAPSSLVPLLVRGPGVPRSTITTPTSSLDITASILAVTETSLSNLEGRSLRPLWQGVTPSRRALLTEYLLPEQLQGEDPVTSDPPPLSLAPPAIPSPPLRYRSILIEPYRYTTYHRGGLELYNLRSDPYEEQNLAYRSRYQKILLGMRRELRRYARCQGAACLLPPRAP